MRGGDAETDIRLMALYVLYEEAVAASRRRPECRDGADLRVDAGSVEHLFY